MGAVEVIILSEATQPTSQDDAALLAQQTADLDALDALLAQLPPTGRSRAEIDAQIQIERGT